MKKVNIVKTHIENDLKNSTPTLVFTDENGVEWVHEELPSNHGGFITALEQKSKSWYFQKNEK